MVFDPLTGGLGLSGAVTFDALVHLFIEGKAAQIPRLAPGAAWLPYLVPALAHSRHQALDFKAMIIVVTAVYPGDENPRVSPDTSQSDYVCELQKHVIATFEGSPWADLVRSVEVREEWRPQALPHVEIGIYGCRRDDDGDG